MTATAIAQAYIIQVQEDHPGNPGWWRFSRPVFKVGIVPELSETRRVWYGTEAEAAEAQAEWDQKYPNG